MNLKARIRKLEEQLAAINPKNGPEPFVIVHSFHGPDELIGYGGVLKLPGESDSALLERAVSARRGKKGNAIFRDNAGLLRELIHFWSIGRNSIKPDQPGALQ